MLSEIEKKFDAWRKREASRKEGNPTPWCENDSWKREEIEALSLPQIKEIALSCDPGWGKIYAQELWPEWKKVKEEEKRKVAWEKKGGVLGAFLLKGGGTFTLRLVGNEIFVPAGEEGRVIGKGGRNIKRIAEITNCRPVIKTINPLSQAVRQTIWNI